jgi:hypothetical protein
MAGLSKNTIKIINSAINLFWCRMIPPLCIGAQKGYLAILRYVTLVIIYYE